MIRFTLCEALFLVWDKMPVGAEFTARQFKLEVDKIYDNTMYIDTVMRRVREYYKGRYTYDKSTMLYTKIA